MKFHEWQEQRRARAKLIEEVEARIVDAPCTYYPVSMMVLSTSYPELVVEKRDEVR
jgi:hypothetical protein